MIYVQTWLQGEHWAPAPSPPAGRSSGTAEGSPRSHPSHWHWTLKQTNELCQRRNNGFCLFIMCLFRLWTEDTQSCLPFTTPTLLWVTEPHLYFGVVTVGFTLTLSPIFMWEGELCGGNPGNEANNVRKHVNMRRKNILNFSCHSFRTYLNLLDSLFVQAFQNKCLRK